MPVIPILPSDSAETVEYKIRLARTASDKEACVEDVKTWRKYYEGDHDLLLNADQLAFLKGVISADEKGWPVDNKVKTVVNKVKGRINVEGFRDPVGHSVDLEDADGEPEDEAPASDQGEPSDNVPAGDAPTPSPAPPPPLKTPPVSPTLDLIVQWWVDNDMDLWESELYKCALRDKESYILVTHNGERPEYTLCDRWDGDYGMLMIYEDPRTRQKPLAAIKYWYTLDPTESDASNVLRATVYTSNAIRKYAKFYTDRQMASFGSRIVGPKTEDGFYPIVDMTVDAQTGKAAPEAWPLPWVDGNGQPIGIAVVPFVCPHGSLVEPIIGLNNALNKTNLDLLSVADQQGFGLIAIQYERLATLRKNDDPTRDKDGLGFRPGRVLETDGTVTKLPSDDMAGLLSLAGHWVQAIAANSNIPLYEFTPITTEVPSGAALQMLDSALADLADECITWFTSAWRNVFTLAQKLHVMYGGGVMPPTRITPVWAETHRTSIATTPPKPQPAMMTSAQNALMGNDPGVEARVLAAKLQRGGQG